MKHIQTILLAVLFLMVGILYYLHFKKPSNSVNLSASAKEVASLSGARVVFINTDTLFEKYGKFKQLEKELEQQQKLAEQGMQSKMKQLEKEYMTLMQQAQAGQINQQQGQAKEQDLIKRKQNIELEGQNTIKALADKTKKMNTELRENIRKHLEDHKSKYNCDYVLGYQTEGALLFVDKKYDITKQVLEALNK